MKNFKGWKQAAAFILAAYMEKCNMRGDSDSAVNRQGEHE